MAVVTVSTFTVKPDRYEDLLANARKFKAGFEKAGAKNIRLLAALVAGEGTGSMAFIMEADDFAANGAVFDNFFGDPEAQALMATTASSGNPSGPAADHDLG
jgi:hypothetical protein